MPVFEDYHRTVVGFHGTTLETAKRIVSGETTFRVSRNDDDWLGHGIYFWEYAPQQAWAWARKRYALRTRIAVVGAMIRLRNCFDLLEPDNVRTLLAVRTQMERDREEAGERPFRKNARAKKYYDCLVFEYAYALFQSQENPVDSISAVYAPSNSSSRLWKSSWISQDAHIQICVRNPSCILGAWLAKEPVE